MDGARSLTGLAIGGLGGVYFLALPGELVVDVWKRDLNKSDARTELRAILAGPDRQMLQEAILSDDGQRARLSAHVGRKGVYVLNVTVSQDEYGEQIAWGFRSNCPRYLIESSRGHKDECHQEPIVLLTPETVGEVCFLPRKGSFTMDLTGVAKGGETLSVYDAADAPVATFQAGADGRASHTFPADERRVAAPWRLHLPKAQATIHIDGVTRWASDDLYPDLPYWTPDPASWFSFQEHRWLLTPYSRRAHGQAGEQAEVTFKVHNNSDRAKTVRLSVEFPADEWPVKLSADHVVLKPKATADVRVSVTVPDAGQARVCHLRATPADVADFSTFSTLTVKAGAEPFSMPLILKPYQHENEQFGYLPDYPVDWEPYFDLRNQPCSRSAEAIQTLRDGRWIRSRLPGRDGASAKSNLSYSKIAFDRDNDLYLLATLESQATLLHSSDRGFSCMPVP
jgi:hypothetical protein